MAVRAQQHEVGELGRFAQPHESDRPGVVAFDAIIASLAIRLGGIEAARLAEQPPVTLPEARLLALH